MRNNSSLVGLFFFKSTIYFRHIGDTQEIMRIRSFVFEVMLINSSVRLLYSMSCVIYFSLLARIHQSAVNIGDIGCFYMSFRRQILAFRNKRCIL